MAGIDAYAVIYEHAFEDRRAVHAYLASTLDFPEWYGNNLDALVDCLTDISTPTGISLVRMRDEGPLAQWFDKLALALMVAGRENPALDIEIFFES
jgi:RNAse (barnase) inhibitor barstar